MEQTLKRKRWKKEKSRTTIIIKNRHEWKWIENFTGKGMKEEEEEETNPNQCTYVNTFANLVRNK